MTLLESTNLANMCDYTFGDQASVINNIPGGFMKDANISNKEFIESYKVVKSSNKDYMTLFIDNIRLYNRDIKFTQEGDRPYVNGLLAKNDLLSLCSKLPDMNFIIFTGFEDTPIDDFIFDKIPNNVLSIFAANALSFGGKVNPIPYGLKRTMGPHDARKNEILLDLIDVEVSPEKLLYVNHTVSNNFSSRGDIHDVFKKHTWATVTLGGLDYETYLRELKNHKFMISPIGNAIDCDCHRNWELFYMRRVPVVKRCEYLEFIFTGYPVLFVDDYSEVTEELLLSSNHLYEEALNIDYKKLDLLVLFNSYIETALKQITL